MLVIRLQRTGRENLATYRIVVAHKARPVKGKFLEIIGHYLPQQDPPVFQCDQEKVKEWIAKGAIPSDTLARLLTHAGMKGLEKFILHYAKQKPKGEQAEAAAPTEVTKTPEAPATEVAPAA